MPVAPRAMAENLRGTREELNLLSADLEGTYPDTRLVARYSARGEERQASYRLWSTVMRGPAGGQTPPQDAAVMIYTWLTGG